MRRCTVALRERRCFALIRSDAGELPLAGCETAPVLEHLWVRVNLLLALGEGALVGLQSQFLARSEAAFFAQEVRVMLGQFLSGGKAPRMPVERRVGVRDAFVCMN
jgi:hypothetical protein